MHEKQLWRKGAKTADFYRQDLADSAKPDTRTRIIHPEDMPWEQCPQGLLKHLSNAGMESINNGQMDLYIQEIPPGSASGKHRHMAEEVIYILDGKGYSLQWDVDAELKEKYEWHLAAEPKRCEWEEGDLVLIPVNTVHQHFNSDAGKPARYVSASNSIYRWLGFLDLEQLEPAPKG